MVWSFILALIAASDPAPGESDSSEEITVIGERIDRPHYQTASSVVVRDARRLANEAVPDRLEQVLQSIPNVQLGSGGEGPTFRGQDSTGAVRDLSAFLSGTRPRTTIIVDARAASYYELAFGMTPLWDVEQIEVFRSPQTTTQGRNSIGGAIFVETKAPTFDWEGGARMIVGEFATRQLSAVVSGPLVDRQMALRVSGDLRRSESATLITNPVAGIDPNRDASETIRFKLLVQPEQAPDLSLALTYAHGHSEMPQIEGVEQPYRSRLNPNASYGIFDISVDSLTGRLSYRPSPLLELKASASYGHSEIRRIAPSGLGGSDIAIHDYSVEPIVTWQTSEAIQLVGGLNLARVELDQAIDLASFPFVLGTGEFTDRQSSFGAFGQGTFEIVDGLSMKLGLRYQRDRQVRRGRLTGDAIDLPLDYDRTFSELLPKLDLSWDASSRWRIGLLVQRASNPGGVNLNFNRVRVEEFGGEHVWSYELYARARSADRKLGFSANLFRTEIYDAQRSQLLAILLPNGQFDTTATIANAPRARVKGLESELNWRLLAGLELGVGVGLLDTRITRTILPNDPMLRRQFQRSPHFSSSASVIWSPTEQLSLAGHLRHHSSYFSDDLESVSRKIAGSTTFDARIAWETASFTLFSYARNLFDEFHLTYLFGPPNFLATAGDPREVGIGLDARF